MPTAVVLFFVRDDLGEGCGRCVGAEVGDGEAAASERVGEERGGEAVPVAGGCSEHDETAWRAAPGEERSESADEPGGERARLDALRRC